MMKILIGYDGSRAAEAAVTDMRKAGLHPKAEARIVIACPSLIPLESLAPNGLTPYGYGEAYAQALENHRLSTARSLKKAQAAAKRIKAAFPGWKIAAETADEVPAAALLKIADAWKPDWIILGSRGWSEFGKLLLGSVADKVMNHAHCPVRIGRRREAAGVGAPNLLIAYDGSPYADAAVESVASRKWPKGTRATVLAVSEILLRMGDISTALTKALGHEVGESAWPWMEARLAKAVKKLEAAGLKARSALAIGETRRTLIHHAKTLKADTVILGCHGFTGFKRLMLGSVSAAVAAHAPCSVEIIRPNRKGVRK